jgi:hypothetical protein
MRPIGVNRTDSGMYIHKGDWYKPLQRSMLGLYLVNTNLQSPTLVAQFGKAPTI